MIDFHDVRDTSFGGTADTLALLLADAAVFLTLPALYGGDLGGLLWAAAGAMVGGLWFGWRVGSKLRLTHGGEFDINSHDAPPAEVGGMRVGFIAHTMQELIVPLAAWMRHAMIVGQSGVGKTVVGAWLMFQQICAGGGLLWIDGKLDPANIEMLHRMCVWAGRADDLLVVNPGTPASSNSYNPLLDGDADEIASRLGALLPEASNNAGADFYRSSAIGAIGSLVQASRAAGYAVSFADLRILLTRPGALEWLLAKLKQKSKAGDAEQFGLFLDQLRQRDRKTGKEVLDADGLRRMFGGLGARLAQFGGGGFGEVMNAYAPEVRLKDAIRQGKVVYFALPTMGKGEAAIALARMAVSDFRSAIAAIQALPESERPAKPFLGFFDEAGSYVTQAWSRMFEQARSARLVMVPAFQTKANLETLGPELRAMVAGNTATKIFFSPGEPDTAEWCADMIGKELREQHTHTESGGGSAKGVTMLDRGRGVANSQTSSTNASHSVVLREDYKVSPDDLAQLGRGEAVVTLEGHRVFHIRVPLLTFDDDFIERAGPFRVRHPATTTPDGLEPLRITQRPGAMR
ncbi:MAG: TraM recognition domain-containing protein [Xanthomonadales bacterium]|nr:TraM recognition domain-containing protein [Xanthomonadales bacterium]ODU93070.1 MAG: hypothetical protein ABT18_09915 [Rhodanobacter sp. SCN 66-43]OJY83761.1 MAG: hypothetical protein BGP23_14095 [Xanthomonadales bacterium 66-474]